MFCSFEMFILLKSNLIKLYYVNHMSNSYRTYSVHMQCSLHHYKLVYMPEQFFNI